MSTISKPAAAYRFARTIASDILLYNKGKIATGIKNDTLFDVIESEIREGHDLYKQRVDPEVREAHNLLDRAIVDVLISASADLPTKIW